MLIYDLDQWREGRVAGINHESSDYGATDTVMRWAVLVVYGSVFGTKMTSHCFQKVVLMAVKR